MRPAGWAAACAALATLSLLVPAAPGYDAWAWLLWGRELGSLALDTVAGPAWKPLPVAVTALLAPAGGLAPELWLAVARAGALAAVALAFVLGRRLGGAAAGALAAAGVLLTGGFVRRAAVGDAEPLLVGLVLGAVLLALEGRHRAALGVGALAALVRPETWPFLAAYALWRRREDAALVAAIAVAVPAAWVLPELLSSGELLRSADRARLPNPGQPATADVPALATLAAAAGILFAPAALAALAARGVALPLAGAGAAWILLVAAMSQAGFSGEPRYALPGAAVLAVGGAAALRGVPRPAVAALAVAAAALGAVRLAYVADLGPRLAHQQRLAVDLERAIAAAGGRDAVLACGRPGVGRYRGTLLAYHLDVPKRTVAADGEPAAVTFRSRLTPTAPPEPVARGTVVAANERWTVTADCISTPSEQWAKITQWPVNR
ncbi:MAG TPA: hypothetical protein VHF89_00325 [Solirubrobacteraceae bacterium]|nr:hypothetical protein [Solirubrobacteraceae bacterium]